jgi:hypothetical protein
MPRLSIPLLNAAMTAALSLILLGWAILRCDGRLIFSLDDPYIHLSMAEQIARGEYGINPGEPASASSSILYPFLLAPAVALGAGEYWALLLSVLSVIAAAWLAGKIASEGGLAFEPPAWFGALALCGAFALATNLPGLASTGMEHSMHAAATAAALLGLIQFRKTGKPALWWIACCGLLAPALRYEGLSVSAAVAIALAFHGRWRAGLLVAALAASVVAGQALFLTSLGLPPMPSSVLVKLGRVAEAGVRGALAQAALNLRTAEGAALSALLLLLLAGVTFRPKGADKAAEGLRGDVGLFCAFVIAAHLAFGHVGWMARYSPYAICVGIAGIAFLFGETVSRVCRSRILAAALSACLVAIFADPAYATARAPLAANSIYRQQFQMHRFIVEYWRAPMAVNDVGWTSYRNDQPVLDLFGLGSEAARLAQRSGDPDWTDRFVRAQGVDAAMIYDEVVALGLSHPQWTRLARLQLVGAFASAAFPSVSIYLVTDAAAPRLCRALADLEPTLPHGAHLAWEPGACGRAL